MHAADETAYAVGDDIRLVNLGSKVFLVNKN